ncbi:metal ABC transporter ATP-binding protein [Methanococcoides alaskense]|uniref:Cobalamin import ATP-binding protein BtuD n=1 Tax=Methanococcoides alaskense TaxID=325778 RepID=A0AA90ZDC7_9EURY|nr:metal ABC transporter ATP-binding protein [Methanococcoides alaskense]MDR6223358.1 zinc transport system ATP-binding protein [Methanococcoides alaskense]
MGTVIDVKDVWLRYKDLTVLEGVNLSIEEGDFLGIIGPNGGGKSTLLKVILGLIKPQRGTVEVLGTTPEKARHLIGYVPQYNPSNLDFPINVREVVLMGRMGKKGLFRKYTEEDHAATKKALETVEMLEYSDRQIGKLSGGQRQRVFIARALVSEPKVLILDEPVTGIDTMMQMEFYELLKKLRSRVTIVMVSHDISAVSVLVDKIACLNGKLHYHGSKELIPEDIEQTYGCPVELIAHGVPHRVLHKH